MVLHIPIPDINYTHLSMGHIVCLRGHVTEALEEDALTIDRALDSVWEVIQYN